MQGWQYRLQSSTTAGDIAHWALYTAVTLSAWSAAVIGAKHTISAARMMQSKNGLMLCAQVLEGLDELLQRQRLQMRTEESQQLRQFRGRLAEIEAQLAAYRQAAATHQDDWMGKTVSNWVRQHPVMQLLYLNVSPHTMWLTEDSCSASSWAQMQQQLLNPFPCR